MTIYQDDRVLIRTMQEGDPQALFEAVKREGWHADLDCDRMRLQDHRSGKCTALMAEVDGTLAGHIYVYRHAIDGPEAFRVLPEIVDFGVFPPFRRLGVGTALMDAAELIAAGWADTVCLGVGLHSGYGSAQRMYVKRGYIPDGSGAWYQGRVCGEYEACCNDDDLVLYFSKSLAKHDQ